MAFSRRRFLTSTAKAGGAAAALAAAGVYERVDLVPGRAVRVVTRAATATLAPEQHLMNLQVIPVGFKGVQKSASGSVNVVVPPLHFQVVTAKLNVRANANSLAAAQQLLETTLSKLDQTYDPSTPAGLGVTVAWGLPYFQSYVPALKQISSYFPGSHRLPGLVPGPGGLVRPEGQPPGPAGARHHPQGGDADTSRGRRSRPDQDASSGRQ